MPCKLNKRAAIAKLTFINIFAYKSYKVNKFQNGGSDLLSINICGDQVCRFHRKRVIHREETEIEGTCKYKCRCVTHCNSYRLE